MNLIASLFLKKCPRCREGDLFVSPFNWKNPLDMPEQCSVCEQKFEPEPGFYYGAMFMSYIVTAFLYLGIVGFLIMYLDFTVNQAFLVLVIFVALTFFLTARLGRSLWIHFMVAYRGKQG
jgi:uncharacterized protein (DUF983 family)